MITNDELLYRAIKAAVDEWNPYGLLPDAPGNEFDRESKAIAMKVSPEDTAKDIAKAVSTVFSSSFEAEGFSIKECTAVAENIKCKLSGIRLKEVT